MTLFKRKTEPAPAAVPEDDGKVKCTYCGGTKFFSGPEGPGGENILCANPDCRHWFNNSIVGLDDLHRVEPTKEEHDSEEQRIEAFRQSSRAERRIEGFNAYKDGQPLHETMKLWRPYDSIYERGAEHGGGFNDSNSSLISAFDMDRMIGYIEAMQEEIAFLRGQAKP